MFRGLRYKEDLFYFLKYLLKQDGLHRAMYTPSSPPPPSPFHPSWLSKYPLPFLLLWKWSDLNRTVNPRISVTTPLTTDCLLSVIVR